MIGVDSSRLEPVSASTAGFGKEDRNKDKTPEQSKLQHDFTGPGLNMHSCEKVELLHTSIPVA